MIMLFLRIVAVVALIVSVFAFWLSYTYGITLHDWWETQQKFYFSDEKSNKEIKRDMKKEQDK